MLNDKEYSKLQQREIDKHHLRMIREDRNELMDRINNLDRLEVSVIKMMVGNNN